jgi:hypothetical protein
MAKLSPAANREILEAALQGLEAQKQKLDEQIAQVRSMMGGRRPGRPPRPESAASKPAAATERRTARRKRVLSPEARKRIAAAQKKRWAAFRKNQG